MIELPALPYALEALAPFISSETLEYHHGKHHRAYVNNLKQLIAGTEFEQMDLERIVRSASGKIFNNAAQVWNHTFYFNSLSPAGGGEPKGRIVSLITANFGSFLEFQKQFAACAVGQFGSGWAWLVKKPSGALEVRSTSNAEPAFLKGDIPLIACDVWEHAYYIDYRNDRTAYVSAFWRLVNWEFAEKNFGEAVAQPA